MTQSFCKNLQNLQLCVSIDLKEKKQLLCLSFFSQWLPTAGQAVLSVLQTTVINRIKLDLFIYFPSDIRFIISINLTVCISSSLCNLLYAVYIFLAVCFAFPPEVKIAGNTKQRFFIGKSERDFQDCCFLFFLCRYILAKKIAENADCS